MGFPFQKLQEASSTLCKVNVQDEKLFQKKYYFHLQVSQTNPDRYILSAISYRKGSEILNAGDNFVFICDEEPTLPSITITRKEYENAIPHADIVIEG